MKVHTTMQDITAGTAAKVLEREAAKLEGAVTRHKRNGGGKAKPAELAAALADAQLMNDAAQALRAAVARASARRRAGLDRAR